MGVQTAGEDLDIAVPPPNMAPEAAAHGAAAAAAAATALGQLAAALASQAPLPDDGDSSRDTLADSPAGSQAQLAPAEPPALAVPLAPAPHTSAPAALSLPSTVAAPTPTPAAGTRSVEQASARAATVPNMSAPLQSVTFNAVPTVAHQQQQQLPDFGVVGPLCEVPVSSFGLQDGLLARVDALQPAATPTIPDESAAADIMSGEPSVISFV